MNKVIIGLDIGGTKCAVLLAEVNRSINFIDKIRFPTHAENGFDSVFEMLCSSINDIINRNHMEISQITAIGISCGGPLDSRRGVVLCPPNLPGWIDIPIVNMLSERFGIPAFLQNDANACALVEWKLGAGRGVDNMVFLTMGTGMGGGIIANGELICGASDMAGEIGHLRLTEEGPVGFGKAGSFEGYTSGGGIQRQAEAYTESLINTGKTPEWYSKSQEDHLPVDAKLMAEYARKGNKEAQMFFDHIGKMLGRGISLIVDTINPEKIVIGSIFVRCEDLLREPMEKELKQESIPFSYDSVQVVPAETGERIGDLASIMVALYALKVELETEAQKTEGKVYEIYERLFARYPVLEQNRNEIMSAYQIIRDCYRQNGKVMVFGNGGSCSDGEHIVGELMKGFYLKRPLDEKLREAIDREASQYFPNIGLQLQRGLPAISLSGHNALSTATANDQNPLMGAAQQIIGYGKKEDVFIGISTSGNSENVLMAALTAKAMGIKTIGLLGKNGGKLTKVCDCSIVVPGENTADIQELHLPVYHTLCAMLEECFFGENE